MEKKYYKFVFEPIEVAKQLGYPTIKVSKARLNTLSRLQDENYHTEVRLKTAQLFKAPNELIKEFKAIIKEHNKANCLTIELHQRRINATNKLNRFIMANYGLQAVNVMLYYQ